MRPAPARGAGRRKRPRITADAHHPSGARREAARVLAVAQLVHSPGGRSSAGPETARMRAQAHAILRGNLSAFATAVRYRQWARCEHNAASTRTEPSAPAPICRWLPWRASGCFDAPGLLASAFTARAPRSPSGCCGCGGTGGGVVAGLDLDQSIPRCGPLESYRK